MKTDDNRGNEVVAMITKVVAMITKVVAMITKVVANDNKSFKLRYYTIFLEDRRYDNIN
jgi:hypothetical protein